MEHGIPVVSSLDRDNKDGTEMRDNSEKVDPVPLSRWFIPGLDDSSKSEILTMIDLHQKQQSLRS